MAKLCRLVNLLVFHCLLSALFFAATAQAEDSQGGVQIESDSFDFDQASGISVYEGNVLVRRGTARLSGNRVEVYANQDAIEKIVATSGLSKFEVVVGNGETLTAQAQKIEVNLDQDVIYFLGKVRMENRGSTLSGEGFVYNLGDDTFKSIEGSGRVRLELKEAERKPRKKPAAKARQSLPKPQAGEVPLTRIKSRDGERPERKPLRKIVPKTTVLYRVESVEDGSQP